jgi:hypothetical protein
VLPSVTHVLLTRKVTARAVSSQQLAEQISCCSCLFTAQCSCCCCCATDHGCIVATVKHYVHHCFLHTHAHLHSRLQMQNQQYCHLCSITVCAQCAAVLQVVWKLLLLLSLLYCAAAVSVCAHVSHDLAAAHTALAVSYIVVLLLLLLLLLVHCIALRRLQADICQLCSAHLLPFTITQYSDASSRLFVIQHVAILARTAVFASAQRLHNTTWHYYYDLACFSKH